jgi:hypothetical protein
MKKYVHVEMYLRNRDIDQLVGALQRLEVFSIRSKQEMKLYEVQLEEIRARFNADFAKAMATRERVEQSHLKSHGAAREKKKTHREEGLSLH